ncbi:hypothetical protein RJI07_04490 [Mycoplasmatota bacterium WC30]
MINQENIEALFDCLDESSTLLYQKYKISYLEGLIKTCENIISNDIEEDYLDIENELKNKINKIKKIEFKKEEIRKAFQYACLRGFKHGQISNQMITPDTIGVFINYLVSKLYIRKKLFVLDPLVGTGNLVTSLANNSDKEMNLFGVDIDVTSYKLSTALFDMLGYGENVYCQDTLTYNSPLMDLIVTDYSGIQEDEVFNIIQHHGSNIKTGGFMVGVFDDETIKEDVLIKHAKDLNEAWKLFGLIKLPAGILKKQNKSIVIFQRNGDVVIQPKAFLIVELPEFTENEEMLKVIDQLNNWFKNTEFYKLGEK